MQKKVSVIIPCYNAERWIGECIESVLKQDYKPIEIIVVDDASTDKSRSKVMEYPVTILLKHLSNLGECAATKFGFSRATGDYLCRLSADDAFLYKGHISEQVEMLESTKRDWCYNAINRVGNARYDSQPVRGHWMLTPLLDNFVLSHPELALGIILEGNPVNSSTLMVTKECYHDVEWDSYYRTDCDGFLLMRMLLAGKKGVAIPSPGAFYRTHPMQTTNVSTTYKHDMENVRGRVCTMILAGNYPLWLKVRAAIVRKRILEGVGK